ncbi:Putative Holin-X, holin superfamily III [Stigmatella aurantiaca]|uniref:Putative Holin-X, holin superfamily III n=1 Tax=Stigmatella aurantiaca TaxID=41 RepID=A0A1H7UTC4_STIAU|nr:MULTISPECIES: phage holin family protein [Stigmatella]SEM00232.1 Putative Holin-X, holin superfamily III [Stigmatella aurantiaca]
MNVGSEQTDRGISALVGRMADGFSRLVSQHLTLARMEMAEDAKAMGKDVARIAAFVPFILVGYLFVCGALAAVLARWLGVAGALVTVGVLNLIGGGIGIHRAISRLQGRQVMDDSAQELSRSVAALGGPGTQDTEASPAAASRPMLKETPHAQ